MGVWSSSGPHCGLGAGSRASRRSAVGFQVIGSLVCVQTFDWRTRGRTVAAPRAAPLRPTLLKKARRAASRLEKGDVPAALLRL